MSGDRLRVRGGRVLGGDGWVEADLLVEDGDVAAIRRRGGRRAPHERVLDASGLLAVPGFVDLQVNGGFGHDVTTVPDSMWPIGRRLPRTGVTAFLPTIVSAPSHAVRSALDVLVAGPPRGFLGSVPLGLHCEGPMIAPARRGAHDRRHLRMPSLDLIEGWTRSAGVRLVTMAPELPGALEVARELRARGVVVSAGHSDADVASALAALDGGFAAGTHLFNAMSGLHHREPGLVGALLVHASAVVGLIADGVHVHPAAVRLAWQAKGPERLALVTDATAAMGTRPGQARLGPTAIERGDGAARDHRGVLAGGTVPLDRAVRNLVRFTGCSIGDAIRAAATTPARLIGEDRRGWLGEGAEADVVLLDERLRIAATIVGGRIAYLRDSGRAAGPG